MEQTTRRRRSPEGGYARGEETRRRIVLAALGLFGEQGFYGASTREIAARAGVNTPALQYYFDSKEGLYRACAEHIAQTSWAMLASAVEALRQEVERGDVESLIESYCRLLERAADFLAPSAEIRSWTRFIAREEAETGPALAREVLEARVNRPTNAVCAAAIGRIVGRPADDPEVTVRMLALKGQFMIFHVAREKSLAALGWSEVDADKLALIKSVLRRHTQAVLRART